MTKMTAVASAMLVLGGSQMVLAKSVEPGALPEPPKFEAQGQVKFVGVKDIFEYKALPKYNEPDFVTGFVKAGKLPPVAERLPPEPLVITPVASVGTYGGTIRVMHSSTDGCS